MNVRPLGHSWVVGKIENDEYISWIDQPEDSLFRLGGFGGCALTLRSCINVGPSGSFDFGVDIGVLTPDRFVEYFARPIGEGFIDKLVTFFWACAFEAVPEKSVATFVDDTAGFNLSVMSSRESVVEVQVHVLEDPDSEIPEIDVVNFETSRVALSTAAEKIRLLNQSKGNLELELGEN